MNIKIRKCMISDAAIIRDLSKSELGFDYPMEKFEENIRRLMRTPGDLILVAENGNTVLGFAHACDFDILYGPRLKILRAIAVNRDYRRCGAAKMLIEAIEQWAKNAGCEGIRIYGGSERHDAIAFYKSCGYSFVKPESQFKKNFCETLDPR